ncbi:D-TA family PLP-dependent enzyme [Reichenbachiella sp.]|uniref:D-TA family PLP-dependent enzyme n=1 Tax=Reichenbachiella sp. TaxID=2184521 RepID=UPI003BB21335
MTEINWFEVSNKEGLRSTPALLVYPDRIMRNIQLMIELADGVEKLRPHIKTHKSADIIKLQLERGITKFKCATIPEAELLAKSGAKDVLLAMQPVGPNILRFFDLMKKYPASNFSTLVDNQKSVADIAAMAEEEGVNASVWLDINNGMNRTGVVPSEALPLFQSMVDEPRLSIQGLHVYDGHIHDEDLVMRTNACEEDFEPVESLRQEIAKYGMMLPKVIAGGTPTFALHKKRKNVELSPGTPLLWDAGYGEHFPDLPFENAAVLATRIVSLPTPNLICLDLGYKAVASEMELPRVKFLGGHDFEVMGHNEEHMVVRTNDRHGHQIGDLFYALPIHICPTVVRYDQLLKVKGNEYVGSWPVATRSH